MYVIIILALLIGYNPLGQDFNFLSQSKEQATYYISQINKGIEQDAYLWALTSLYESHPEISNFISDQLSSTKNRELIYAPFISNQKPGSSILREVVFASGSPDLLIALLLREQDKNTQIQLKEEFQNKFELPSSNDIAYEALINRIINGKIIESSILPNNRFQLPHFFLFMDRNSYKLFPKEYYSNVLKDWENDLKISSNDSIFYALLQVTHFRALYLLDDYDPAKKLFDFFSNDKLIPNNELKIQVFRYLDYSLYRLGYYDLSLKATRDYAIPLAKYLDNKSHELRALAAQAAYLDHIGKIKEAQKINLEILEKSEQYNINVPKSTIYANLGLTYRESGEFDKHLDLQLQALDEARNQENYNHQLKILLILHQFFLENKDRKSALLYLNQAEGLAESQENLEHLGRVSMYFGMLHRDLDRNFEKSLQYFEKAQELLDPNANFKNYVQLLGEKASLYKELTKYELSRKIYNEVVELSASRDNVKLIEAYLQIIDINLITGNLKAAEELLKKVRNHDLNQLKFEKIVKAKRVEAEYLILTDKTKEAYNTLKPALERVVSWAKNTSDVQSGFWNIDVEIINAFQLMADLLIDTGKNEEAVELLDKLKTINDASLYQNPMVKSSLLDEKELTQYQRLTGQLDALRKKQLLASEKEQLNLQSKIDRLIAQKNVLDRKISGMVDQESVSINEVQRQLAGREMVLHITELNDQYYIAKISRSDVKFNTIPLDSTLRAQFDSAIKNLSVGKTDVNKLAHISDILDLASLPSWINTLTIIPDSYLYQLPIDVLPINKKEGFGYSYGETTYVVEQFKTHYLTSLNDFKPKESIKKDYRWDFAGYGVSKFPSHKNRKTLVPLPYAGSEITNISASLSNMTNKTTYIDYASTERTFKETASQARILHLATHSELSERDPLFSRLYMSADTSDQLDDNFSGQIFAYELFELNLANDLIMLNSCESGSGSYLQGTGVMGISRALRYAGANSLILNLWSVNDMMASDFAIEFYKNINQGQAKDEALRQTKLHFLKNKNANPHYWGPYMLIGNRDPLVQPNRETNIYFAASFMLFFITIASISLLQDWKGKAA